MSQPIQGRSRAFGGIVIALLLFFGVQLWFVIMHGVGIRRYQPTMIAVIAVLAAIRPAARGFTFLLDRIRYPSSRTLSIVAICIFIIAAWFLYFEATYQHRDLQLRYQDEYSYRIQTRMVAEGELWKPTHPLVEFFESFQLLATPVYASIYFPGTAILYAPGIWFGWPKWVIPLLSAAGVISLIYCVFTRLIDGVAGMLGAILAASIPIFREHSTMGMAQVPALLFVMLLAWIWLCWRKRRGLGLAVVAGAMAGWLIITRPVDSLTIILPVMIAVMVDLRNESWSRRGKIAIAAIIGALPFIAIQLIFNFRVTGSLLETPFVFYTHQVYPQGTYGFHGNIPTSRPTWPLPQVQQAYDQLVHGLLHDHTPAKKFYLWRTNYLPDILDLLSPHRLFIILLPIGLLGLRGKRWVVFTIFPLFILLYFPYLFFMEHYVITMIPAVLMVLVLSVSVLSESSAWLRPHLLTFLTLSIVVLTLSQSPPFNRFASDDIPYWGDSLRAIDKQLAELPHKPAIVLFRYSPKIAPDLEPVYNADVTWPDDAPVIRAHDRGEKNVELYRYYAQRQPDRWVYLYDRISGTITELGQVTKLAEASR